MKSTRSLKTTEKDKPVSRFSYFDKNVIDLKKELGLIKLPDEVAISTMTFCCSLNTKFLCNNIAKYIDISPEDILGVTHGIAGDMKTNRSLLPKKSTSAGKAKRKKNVFYNQVSIYVNVSSKKKNPVNVKLFSNGSIQMTGCKTIENALEALTKIFKELKKSKAVINYKKLVIEERPMVENSEILEIKNLQDFKIAMINSNFKIPFIIDRRKLYNLMLQENYDCLFDPNKHACVNIKFFANNEKIISIFVFEGGSIIITGARNCNQILDGYNFINKYLLSNHKHIVKNNNNSNFVKFLEDTGEASDLEFDIMLENID